MKKIKVLGLILLMALTFLSVSVLLEGVVTIEGYGKATGHISSDGTVYYKCDNSDNKSCTITIRPPVE